MEPRSTPFEILAKGDLEAMKRVLAEEPGLAEVRDERGVSLLLHSLYHRKNEMTDLLSGYRKSIDYHEAAALGRVERVEACLEEDPSLLSSLSNDGFAALHLAAFFGRFPVITLLLARGADVALGSANPMKVTALHSAVAGRDYDCVAALVEAGSRVDERQQGGYTPLMGAAAAGNESMARLLLGAGADPSLRSEDGKTARDIAIAHDHEEIASLLGG